MSFGFSVGDFLAVLELANKVRRKWNEAPEEYSTMKDETRNVSVLLENVRKLSQQGTLSDEHIAQIKDSSTSCLKVLQRCEVLADKFTATTAGHSSLKSKWKRLQLDPDDVRAVRDQLVSCVSSLNALLIAIQSFRVNAIGEGVDGMRDREAGVLLSTIADWYSSDDFAKHQDHCLSLRLPGTGVWAVTDPKYKQWENGDTDTLLCPGIPGSGKSILHATLVDDLRTRYEHDDSVVVVYFYCSFQRQAEQTVRNILSVLVRQMFQEQDKLFPKAKALYDKHCQRRTSPSLDELEELLHSLVQGYRKVFIMMDAMDECMRDESDCIDMLDRIFNLQRSKRAVKLLVTTRWMPRIINHFAACPQLEIRARQEDIELYLDHSIPRLPVKPHAKIKVDNILVTIQDAVKSRIIDAADGMFLLARLQFDSLTDKTNPRKLQQALLQLSSGSRALESEYDKALLRIDQQREGFREIAYKVLAWIVYARRELSIDELREAVAIYDGMDDIDHDTDLEEEEQLASVCAGLVRIDHEARVMRLVHYTTQKYLQKVLTERNEGETSVARDCLTYLSMNVFKQYQPEQMWDAPARSHQKYKLFRYAAQQWGEHVKPEFEQDLIPYIDDFLFSPETLRIAIDPLFDRENGPLVDRYEASPAHVCAYFGMTSTLSRIINQGEAIDDKDGFGETPLSWAAKHGRTEIAKILLERSNVSINSSDNDGGTPLYKAVSHEHLDMVEILLQRADIEIDLSTCFGMSPLHRAVSNGNADIIKLLLQHTGMRATRVRVNDSILQDAMMYDCNVETVKLLMDRAGLSVCQSLLQCETTQTETPKRLKLLKLAVRIQDLEMLKMLMGHAYILDDPSPLHVPDLLHHAAEFGTVEIMEYLLSLTNADLNLKDSHGETLLCKASRGAQTEIARNLLRHLEVDPELSDHDGRTPLSYAAGFGSREIVQCLLQQSGVNPESADHYGRTPLSYAAENYSGEIVKVLLEQSTVQPNSQDHQGRTPLYYAAADDNGNIVQILLALPQIDMDASDSGGFTPFLQAVRWSNNEVIGLFLRRWSTRSDSTKAYFTLAQKAIQDLCRVWGQHSRLSREQYNPLLSRPYEILDLLGRCLLSLEYRDASLFAFRQQITFEQDTLLAFHRGVSCDGCRMSPITDRRFICMTCFYTDLCLACMEKYTNGKILEDCADHEFLEVPGQKNSGENLGELDQVTESFQDPSMAPRDQLQSNSDSDSAASAEWRKGIEERYRKWGF